MHEKDARLASGRWAVVHGNVAPGADLDGLDEEAGFQGGGDGGHGTGHGLLRRSARFVNVEESPKHNHSSFRRERPKVLSRDKWGNSPDLD